MKYHLIGDQGVSMRGIKKYLEQQGHTVTGSDLKTGGHKPENITSDIDVIVRTSAANDHSEASVELEEAKKKNIKVIRRSEMLQQIADGKTMIAVSGMHGKTTVTTMAGLVLANAGADPTVFVGADVKDFEGVVRIGASNIIIIEACEYDRAFLDFYPKILILTNIEEEHLDTYPNGLPEIKSAFIEYINHIPDDGLIIACSDDENIKDVLSKVKTKAKIIYYGFSASRFNHLDFTLPVPGKHNIQNALAILALADYLDISPKVVAETLQKFRNADRRFQLLGNYNGADLLDDYGHHPTEIKTTIDALCERYPDKQKIVVFWPHQYKRIKPLLDQFAESFAKADLVILKPIYFVPGRDEKNDIESENLCELINKDKEKAVVMSDDKEIAEYLKTKLNDQSVLLTIGIPPVYKVIERILNNE